MPSSPALQQEGRGFFCVHVCTRHRVDCEASRLCDGDCTARSCLQPPRSSSAGLGLGPHVAALSAAHESCSGCPSAFPDSWEDSGRQAFCTLQAVPVPRFHRPVPLCLHPRLRQITQLSVGLSAAATNSRRLSARGSRCGNRCRGGPFCAKPAGHMSRWGSAGCDGADGHHRVSPSRYQAANVQSATGPCATAGSAHPASAARCGALLESLSKHLVAWRPRPSTRR